jgi:peroxiredoxin
MYSCNIIRLLLLALLLCGCGNNLLPSGDDKRPPAQTGTVGSAVGQLAPDFSVANISGTTITLADALNGKQAAVLYFSMWCPICDSHMNNMRSYVAPNFPDVRFYIIDYVSGSTAEAAAAAAASGYASSAIGVLADAAHQLTLAYQGTMGSTIVIDSIGIIRMNEDYRDGSRLQTILGSLP